jgi:feruloyl esterase
MWYDEVYSFYGSLNQTSIQDFYRPFMVPDMEECSGGGGAWATGAASQSGYLPSSNASEYSLLWSLIDWVENEASEGPERMVGTKYIDDAVGEGVQFTKPYCKWPNVLIWGGVGDVDREGSWSCPTAGFY